MTENVLVLMSDEHQARALGCAGHEIVQTPNLDGLAARGTRFTSAWTPSPICVPARASFATGRWVHEVGAWDSAQPYEGRPRGWAHELRDVGYDVVSFGKLHHRGEQHDDGFTERVLPLYVTGGLGWVQGLARDDPIPFDEAAELAADIGTGHTTYTRYDQRITDAATAWLRRPPDRPWCAFVSLVAPHFPLSAPDAFTERYRLEHVPPPEIPAQPLDHPAVAGLASYFDYHRYFDAERTRRGRRAYFALCSWLDENVGRLLDALERSGQAGRTRVIYTSDHGEMAGNRGLWCKSFLYRDSVDVPLIIAGPGAPAGITCDTNVGLTDIAATVTQAAGIDRGESLWDIALAPERSRIAFSEYHDGGSITGSFAIRNERWKYLEHVGHRPQLFDRVDDPDELVDLGADPRLKAVRVECADLLRSIVDPEAVSSAAFAAQRALLERLGGRRAVANGLRFNHTPIPS